MGLKNGQAAKGSLRPNMTQEGQDDQRGLKNGQMQAKRLNISTKSQDIYVLPCFGLQNPTSPCIGLNHRRCLGASSQAGEFGLAGRKLLLLAGWLAEHPPLRGRSPSGTSPDQFQPQISLPIIKRGNATKVHLGDKINGPEGQHRAQPGASLRAQPCKGGFGEIERIGLGLGFGFRPKVWPISVT